jgi:hypothetical protein
MRGGQIVIQENNKWVLRVEIILTSLLVLFGIERFIKILRE